jgi:hypothetical protein
MNTTSHTTELAALHGVALVPSSDRKKLEAIGKKMETLLKQVDELFGDARELIGFETRDSECYTELPDYWDDMGKALLEYAIEARTGWKREEVIKRMTTEMKTLGITADMLSRQNND